MRTLRALFLIGVTALFLAQVSGCATLLGFGEDLPPGQEKKVEDEQSAKKFAPGQEKGKK